jgi:hypothetical protein
MQAFEAFFEAANITAEQLLSEDQRPVLIRVLSYHVVPDVAVAAADLVSGAELPTLLEGANLTVGTPVTNIIGTESNATVVAADLKAGKVCMMGRGVSTGKLLQFTDRYVKVHMFQHCSNSPGHMFCIGL